MQSRYLHLSPLSHALAQCDTNPASTGIVFHRWNVLEEPVPVTWTAMQLPHQVVAHLLVAPTLP